MYSGPIRSAGGTAAAASVIVADYIRKEMGYDRYDPSPEEIKRMSTELYDYHDRVTNLQYLPSTDEIEFLISNLPVQIDGDPSEEEEVSQYKDLPRIETNRIRSGPCLVIGEGIAQKAPKLWKQLGKWGVDFKLEHWFFLEKFISLQKKVKSKDKIKETTKVAPTLILRIWLQAGRS
jgi:DNA polymerase II large subunit